MKWVRASDRLPDLTGEYKFRLVGSNNDINMFYDKNKEAEFIYYHKVGQLEWLDESETHPDDTAHLTSTEANKKRLEESVEQLGVSNSEQHCLGVLVEAWNIFNHLPVMHTDDINDFRFHIHALQNIIMSRTSPYHIGNNKTKA